jgi:hypothetical protein
MVDETEREALAQLIAIELFDRTLRAEDCADLVDAMLAAGIVSPSRHRAEVEAAWKAGRDAAVAECLERGRSITPPSGESNG